MTDAATGRAWLAQAKINLALHVTGRRPDHYHELDMLVVFADVGDRITVLPAPRLQLAVGGPFADKVPPGSGNLALKAAWALWTATDRGKGARIILEKTLPVGAGLGGGSADAASVLLALESLWQMGLSKPALSAIAATLGADVPLCLNAAAVRARGTGDMVEPVSGMPDLPMVLVWPGEAVATADVFAKRTGAFDPPLPALPAKFGGAADVAAWLEATTNGLADAATSLAPVIAEANAALAAAPGCLLARMTGSGSTCFGIFPDSAAAGRAAGAIGSSRPEWWVKAITAG